MNHPNSYLVNADPLVTGLMVLLPGKASAVHLLLAGDIRMPAPASPELGYVHEGARYSAQHPNIRMDLPSCNPNLPLTGWAVLSLCAGHRGCTQILFIVSKT